MNLKERIKEFISHLGIETRAFEANCELSNGFVNNAGHSIREKSIVQISKAYPELNMDWLLTGKGDMVTQKSFPQATMIQQPTEGYIPVYDVTFTLGFTPTFIDARENLDVLGYVNFPELRGSTYVVKAKGDSMAPLINDKDFVGIRPVKNKKTIDYGNPYGIITEDLAVFKRIRTSRDENKIKLVSDNENHDTYEIEKEEVIHLFAIIGILSVKSITH